MPAMSRWLKAWTAMPERMRSALLAEKIERLDRLLGEADDALGRKSAHWRRDLGDVPYRSEITPPRPEALRVRSAHARGDCSSPPRGRYAAARSARNRRYCRTRARE